MEDEQMGYPGTRDTGRGSCLIFAIFKLHEGTCDISEEKDKEAEGRKGVGRKMMWGSGGKYGGRTV